MKVRPVVHWPPDIASHSGRESAAWVYQTANTWPLGCWVRLMPQPLSAAFHQRSVTSKSGRLVASSHGRRFGYATSKREK